MRLLNSTTRKLRLFVRDPPEYVILSHTWGTDEVTFDDIDQPHAENLRGYRKIVGSCEQALRDGFEWIWIDTCCIDKRSSSELSEAINSMFQWYWRAQICYVFMSSESGLNQSKPRWFERGWTLQELLAPAVVEFYDSDWVFQGTKSSLIDMIESATTIERKYLLDRDIIKDASIATKFGWASMRETTRQEDVAYCLLGLVDVNMPLLYGEGNKAFYRLQLELLKKTNEHTIFAWASSRENHHSMLAHSPRAFANSAGIYAREITTAWVSTHEMTNMGLKIMLPSIRRDDLTCLVIISCQYENDKYIGIWLEWVGNDQYRRLAGSQMEDVSLAKMRGARYEKKYMYILVDDPAKDSVRTATCGIRVLKPNTERSSYELKSAAIGSGAIVELIPTALEMMTGYALQLEDDDYGSLLFADGGSRILICFGQHCSRIWLRSIKDEVRPSGLRYALKMMARECSSSNKKWEFIGDHLKEVLNDGTTVTVKAKKRRIASSLWWDLTIEIRGFE